MAYTGIIATEAELDAMAGENVDTTGWTEANKNLWMAQVEGMLSVWVQYDIATNFGSLDGVGKKILNEYAARYCGICGIAYNFLGDGGNTKTRIESEDQINIHLFRMEGIKKIIDEGKMQKFLGVS
ncbi:MAG: hypothetical protein CMI54_01860 [Parcubacteria group bacterium]|nr:hypothetical protein [Parcubacteria group bacterium]|tara:strand:+ start:2328 stop:2705 length:378 start_codon:yes stop_codon:yes gene_type:complete